MMTGLSWKYFYSALIRSAWMILKSWQSLRVQEIDHGSNGHSPLLSLRHMQKLYLPSLMCVQTCTETRQTHLQTSTLHPGKLKPQPWGCFWPASSAQSRARGGSWSQQRSGVSQVSRGMLPEEIRGGKGPSHVEALPGAWHPGSLCCKNQAFFIFFCPVLIKNKMCKHISPLARSLSLGRMLGFLKKPMLNQQIKWGRQKVRWKVHPNKAFR